MRIYNRQNQQGFGHRRALRAVVAIACVASLAGCADSPDSGTAAATTDTATGSDGVAAADTASTADTGSATDTATAADTASAADGSAPEDSAATADAGAKVYDVAAASGGFVFTPAELTIKVGDTVKFTVAGNHNAIEVDEATWTAGKATPMAGGFEVAFGATKEVAFDKVGTHWFVCAPHAGMGMKGKIIVQ